MSDMFSMYNNDYNTLRSHLKVISAPLIELSFFWKTLETHFFPLDTEINGFDASSFLLFKLDCLRGNMKRAYQICKDEILEGIFSVLEGPEGQRKKAAFEEDLKAQLIKMRSLSSSNIAELLLQHLEIVHPSFSESTRAESIRSSISLSKLIPVYNEGILNSALPIKDRDLQQQQPWTITNENQSNIKPFLFQNIQRKKKEATWEANAGGQLYHTNSIISETSEYMSVRSVKTTPALNNYYPLKAVRDKNYSPNWVSENISN